MKWTKIHWDSKNEQCFARDSIDVMDLRILENDFSRGFRDAKAMSLTIRTYLIRYRIASTSSVFLTPFQI